MKKTILLLIVLNIEQLAFAQGYDRGGEEPVSGLGLGGIIVMFIIGIIVVVIKGESDLKRRKKAFSDFGIDTISKIEFGRYAIKGDTRLEYPIAFISNNSLTIISKEEADKSGKIEHEIVISIDNLQKVIIAKTQDRYAKYQSFTGALTLIEKDSTFTELVFNDSIQREVARFTELQNKLKSEFKLPTQ